MLRIEPMPVEWFDYPEARRALRGSADEEIAFLKGLIGRHLAGFPKRSTATGLASWIRSPASFPPRKAALYDILENISSGECAPLLSRDHFSVYEVARAITLSEASAPDTLPWLHQFAVDPRQDAHR